MSMNPIDKLILGNVRCTICGAGYGKCGCWSRCDKCRCMYETGKECRRCAGDTPQVVAIAPRKKRKATGAKP